MSTRALDRTHRYIFDGTITLLAAFIVMAAVFQSQITWLLAA